MWNEKQRESFKILMKKLCEAPILTLPAGMEDIIFYNDASDKGLSYVLMQRGNFISYASSQLNNSKTRYLTYNIELDTIVFS